MLKMFPAKNRDAPSPIRCSEPAFLLNADLTTRTVLACSAAAWDALFPVFLGNELV